MSGVLVKGATVGLLLLGGAMIAAGQYHPGAVPDDEASMIRGAGCVLWVKDGGCPNPDKPGCGAYDDYDVSCNGNLKKDKDRVCGASSCGQYDMVKSCDS